MPSEYGALELVCRKYFPRVVVGQSIPMFTISSSSKLNQVLGAAAKNVVLSLLATLSAQKKTDL